MQKIFPVWFLFFSFLADAQPAYFEKSFGGTGNDFARSVRQLADGSIYVAGYSNSGSNGGFDFALSKLDSAGNLLWMKYYGDSLDNNGLYMNWVPDGSFIFTGETQTAANGLDILLYKIDSAGTVLWSKKFGGPQNESAKYVSPTTDGGFILCGFKSDSTGTNDTYVLKLNSAGNFLWDVSIGGADNDYSDMVVETPEGDFIVTADTKSKGAGEYDVQVTKLNSAGMIIWDSTYGDTLNNGCQGIFVTSQNKYLSFGETEAYMFSPFDFYLELLDTNGSSIWKRTFGGSGTDAIFSAKEIPGEGFICTGYSNSYVPGPLSLVVMKTDTLGNMKWIRSYGDAGVDIGYEIVPSVYGGYLVCGKIFNGSSDDFYLLYTDTSGMVTSVIPKNSAEAAVSVFPNPFAETAVLRITNNSELRITDLKMFDITGREVHLSFIRNSVGFVIRRSNLAAGIYFFTIDGKEGRIGSGKIAIR